MKSVKILSVVALSFYLFSCVPARKFEEIKAKQEKCEEERTSLAAAKMNLENENSELKNKIKQINEEIEGLRQDTTVMGTSLRQLRTNYDQINRTYQLLLEKNRELLAGNAEETRKLMGELQKLQSDLQKKEDALKILEMQLTEREAKVKELEKILSEKDKAVKELKAKVQAALLGFENNGLTIEQKNGKIYVSLEENLLFKTGSYTVDKKGEEVLKKLGKMLEQNPEINIMVEGHTDNVPYKGSGTIKDNWDLSVLRATSVARIILSSAKIDPKRIVAAGRGEFFPIASNDTPEGRAKNRRTEIILTPKVDELLKILETH
ncbi:MAG: cell envelope biogenesis protein OmpA [Vicingaceae bacterium]|nr:MAG: cell envelope biogenesis protein OmpA [Vicingaceae bacterium]